MNRILVIGSSAAGKSTVAREISELLGVELIHLDKELWKPGCRLSNPDEEREVVARLLELRDRWVMDGNYTESLKMRLERADSVVWVDFSRPRCLLRAMRRLLQFRGRTRPDMGAGCPEEFNLHFIKWIWRYPHDERPKLDRLVAAHGPHVTVHHLRNPRHVRDFLEHVRRTVEPARPIGPPVPSKQAAA
jgi:adenylate kinase family enzyme